MISLRKTLFALSLITCSPSYGQDIPRPPIPRCDYFLNPLYGEQALVFNSQAYEHIQKHSISKLAQQLRDQNIVIAFDINTLFGAYRIQSHMLARLIQEIFTRTSSLALQQDFPNFRIPIEIPDHAMKRRYLKFSKITDFQMSLLKSGNPMMAPLSKTEVRSEFNIWKDAKVASYYSDSIFAFIEGFSKAQTKPDFVIVSTKEIEYSGIEKMMLRNQFPDYKVVTLTNLQKHFSNKKVTRKFIVLNDTRYRMMEIYAASDYAVVIGSNNIFEPLQNHCPVIYFKNSWRGNWFEKYENKILTKYDPKTWKIMNATADQTHGAIGIIEFSELPHAIEQIEKIRPQDILHPAFVTPTGRSQSRFDDLLDQLKTLVLQQLKARGISL